MVNGKLFHNSGPTMENAQSPLDDNWVREMESSDWSAGLTSLEVE